MADVESMFRQKLSLLVRDPKLTHTELIDKMKPYMGNPFLAPGSLGARVL